MAILTGRATGPTLEYFDKIIIASEPYPVTNFLYGKVCLTQVFRRFLHPYSMQIMNQGMASFLFEQSTHIILPHHHVTRHGFDGNVLIVMLPDILNYFANLRMLHNRSRTGVNGRSIADGGAEETVRESVDAGVDVRTGVDDGSS